MRGEIVESASPPSRGRPPLPPSSGDASERTDRHPRAGRVLVAIAGRSFALFLGLFAIANLTIGLHRPSLDANRWWIDLRPLPAAVANLLLILSAFAFALQGIAPRRHRWDRSLVFVSAAALAGVTFWNGLHAWQLMQDRVVDSTFRLPFSFLVSFGCLGVALTLRAQAVPFRLGAWLASVGIVATLCAGFPIAQMWCFGKTDYRRPGDAAVVFGAGVRPDGTPSLALSDRVRTACELYRSGLVRTIIVSGGPTPGSKHEVDVMRSLAVEHGVPFEDVIVDPLGVDTMSTVRNVVRIAKERGAERLLAVSHFYHLPRIKMAFERASWEVFTVPANETRPLLRLPWYVVREVAAFWYYYAAPIVGSS